MIRQDLRGREAHGGRTGVVLRRLEREVGGVVFGKVVRVVAKEVLCVVEEVGNNNVECSEDNHQARAEYEGPSPAPPVGSHRVWMGLMVEVGPCSAGCGGQWDVVAVPHRRSSIWVVVVARVICFMRRDEPPSVAGRPAVGIHELQRTRTWQGMLYHVLGFRDIMEHSLSSEIPYAARPLPSAACSPRSVRCSPLDPPDTHSLPLQK